MPKIGLDQPMAATPQFVEKTLQAEDLKQYGNVWVNHVVKFALSDGSFSWREVPNCGYALDSHYGDQGKEALAKYCRERFDADPDNKEPFLPLDASLAEDCPVGTIAYRISKKGVRATADDFLKWAKAKR